ncbi:MAG: type III restriction endonuclease subunit R, partial [Actinomycetota bacterium]
EGIANDAFVRVERIDYKKGIKAKLRIHAQTAAGPKEKSIIVKNGADLFALSSERANYAEGFSVAEINAEPGGEFIRFSNGRTLRQGEEMGGMRDDIWRAQIKHTIRQHLNKELILRDRGIKVLSLFFIDRVANYRDYDDEGRTVKGKFADAFEAELAVAAKDERFSELEWLKQPIDKLHDGYFAQDRKGALKDTRGNTQADDEVYNLIMKEKERLLSMDEPLRFIFSHSALREGWDNPNVFQICTLNETRSAVKKRQEIGRGLRLPVDQNGLRVFDESVNKLYVMANESYDDFARALQTEYEEECGVTFGKVPLTALAKLTRIEDGREQPIGGETAALIHTALVEQGMLDAEGRIQPAFDPRSPGFRLELPEAHRELTPAVIDLLASYQIERHIQKARDEVKNRLKKEVTLSPEFQELWDRIKPRTTYRVEFETDKLVERAVYAIINYMDKIEAPRITVKAGQLGVGKGAQERAGL